METRRVYWIEVNLARKGAPPSWHPLEDEHGNVCEWTDAGEAHAALVSEGRGEHAIVLWEDRPPPGVVILNQLRTPAA